MLYEQEAIWRMCGWVDVHRRVLVLTPGSFPETITDMASEADIITSSKVVSTNVNVYYNC